MLKNENDQEKVNDNLLLWHLFIVLQKYGLKLAGASEQQQWWAALSVQSASCTAN